MASPPSSYWPCHCQLLRDAQLGPCTLPACSNCPLPERRPFPDLGEQLGMQLLHWCYYTLGSQRGPESQLCQGPLLSQQRTSRKAVSLFSEGGSSHPPKRLPSSCPVPDFSSRSLNWRLRTAFVLFVERDMFAQPCVTPYTFSWEFNPQRPGQGTNQWLR